VPRHDAGDPPRIAVGDDALPQRTLQELAEQTAGTYREIGAD
jgi:hypothetical protein